MVEKPSKGAGDDLSEIIDLLVTPAQSPVPASTAPEAGGAPALQQSGDAAPPYARTLDDTLAGYNLGKLLKNQLRIPGSTPNVSDFANDYESLITADPNLLHREMRGMLRDVRHNKRHFTGVDVGRAPILQQSLWYNLAIRELGYLCGIFAKEFEHVDRGLDLRKNVKPGEIADRLPRIIGLVETAKRHLGDRSVALGAVALKVKSEKRSDYMQLVDLYKRAIAFLDSNYPQAEKQLYDGGANYPLQVRRDSRQDKSTPRLRGFLLPAEISVPIFDNRYSLGVVGSPSENRVVVHFKNKYFITPVPVAHEKALSVVEIMMSSSETFYRHMEKIKLI